MAPVLDAAREAFTAQQRMLAAQTVGATLEDARRYLRKKGVTFNKKWLPAIGTKRRGVLILAAYLLRLYS